jgi:hypothetical protein
MNLIRVFISLLNLASFCQNGVPGKLGGQVGGDTHAAALDLAGEFGFVLPNARGRG